MVSVKQRLVTVLAVCLMAFGSAQAQQDRSAPESSRCIESLEIPKYPSLARSARLTGTVQVHAVIAHRSATQITVDGAHRMLQEAVEASMSNSEFLQLRQEGNSPHIHLQDRRKPDCNARHRSCEVQVAKRVHHYRPPSGPATLKHTIATTPMPMGGS